MTIPNGKVKKIKSLLRKEEKSCPEIAKEVGVSKTSVYNLAVREGLLPLKLKKPGRKKKIQEIADKVPNLVDDNPAAARRHGPIMVRKIINMLENSSTPASTIASNLNIPYEDLRAIAFMVKGGKYLHQRRANSQYTMDMEILKKVMIDLNTKDVTVSELARHYNVPYANLIYHVKKHMEKNPPDLTPKPEKIKEAVIIMLDNNGKYLGVSSNNPIKVRVFQETSEEP